MDDEVLDLDILRPKAQWVKLGQNKIDVSFIPCGITFEVDGIVREMSALDTEKLQEGGEETKRGFDLALKLCATFCSWKHPEMTEDWFRDNTDPAQINKLSETIQATLQRSYAGVEAYQKN